MACDTIPTLEITLQDGTVIEEESKLVLGLMSDRGMSRAEAMEVYEVVQSLTFSRRHGDWLTEGKGDLNDQGEPRLESLEQWVFDLAASSLAETAKAQEIAELGGFVPSDVQLPSMLGNQGPTLSPSDLADSIEEILDPEEQARERKVRAINGALRALDIRIHEFQSRSGERAKKGRVALSNERDAIADLLQKNMLDDALLRFAKHAVHTMDLLTKRMKNDDMSLADLHEMQMYAKGYGIAQEILDEIDEDERLRDTYGEDLVKSLERVQAQITRIEKKYKKSAARFIALRFAPFDTQTEYEYLQRFKADFKNGVGVVEGEDEPAYLGRRLSEEGAAMQSVKENSILSALSHLSHDIGAFEQFIEGIQHMDDKILQLTHQMIWRQQEEVRREFGVAEEEIGEVYRALVAFKNNPADQRVLYGDMLEEDDKGRLTSHLVTNISSRYEAEKNRVFSEARDIMDEAEQNRVRGPGRDYAYEGKRKAAQALRRNWLNENATQSEEYLKMTNEVTRLVREEGAVAAETYRTQWLEDNADVARWIPKEQWHSEKYKAIMALEESHPVRRFYEVFMRQHARYDDLRPTDQRLHTRLAGIRKDASERMWGGNDTGLLGRGFDEIKDRFSIQQDDTEYGSIQYVDQGLDGLERKRIPVHYSMSFRDEIIRKETKGMSAKESAAWEDANEDKIAEYVERTQSFDLTSLLLANAHTSLQYKHLSELLPEMHALDVLLANRKVSSSEGRFKKKFKSLRGDTSDNEVGDQGGRAYDVFKQLVDRDIYGIRKVYSELDKPMGQLMKFTSATMLHFNVLSAARNFSSGWLMQITEAAGGRYVSGRSWRKAHGNYYKDMGAMVGDMGRNDSRSLVNLIGEEFDFLNEFKGARHRYADSNQLLKQIKMSRARGLEVMGDHFLQHITGLAVLEETEARDADGKSLGSLADLYTADEHGKLVLRETPAFIVLDGVQMEWNADSKFRVTNLIRHVNERLYGALSPQNATLIQRTIAGSLVMMMRRWVVPTVQRRWGGAYRAFTGRNAMKWEYQSGEYEEGSYITLGRKLGQSTGWMFRHLTRGFFNNLLKDTRYFGWTVKTDWPTLTEFQRSNIKKSVTELAFAVSAYLMGSLMNGLTEDEDDEELKAWYARGTYLMFSIEREIAFYVNPAEGVKTLQDVSPVISTLETITKAIIHLNGEVYQSGRREGQMKLYKDLTDLAPWYRQYDRWQHPEDILAFFNDKR